LKTTDKRLEQRIMDSATSFIFQKGVRGWSMDQLAATAGLAKNTLYKMVSSKEDLVEKVIVEYVQGIQSKMVAIIDNEPDYLTALDRMAEHFSEVVGGPHINILQEVFMDYPSIEETVYRHRDELTVRIIRFLEEGINKGILRSDLEPGLIFQMLQALVLYFARSTSEGPELRGKLKLAFKCLINGVRAQQSL